MSKPNYQPLADRIIVAPQTAEQVTKSGIFIPDSAQEKPQTGTVLVVGPGRVTEDGKNVPMSVKEGDVVIYAKYGGTELKVDGAEFLIIRESDVLAIKK
jgi:chaperonin GroES